MSQNFFEHKVERDTLCLYGHIQLLNLDDVNNSLYHMIERSGYKDIIIDMKNIVKINYNVMPAIASICRYYAQEYNIDFDVVQPDQLGVRSTMRNSGLFYYINTDKNKRPDANSSAPKILSFRNHEEQIESTDQIINNILRTTTLDREHIKALEWAINEITDNVLTHSKSKVGGFLITYPLPGLNIIELVVSDRGIGISQSLGESDDLKALSMAIQEGVTSNKSTNQGNGLYGTYRLACASSGIFVLRSRRGNLYVTKKGETHQKRENILHRGTLVTCQINHSQPDLIERAFNFNGRSHVPEYDYIEKKHESSDEYLTINAYDICKTFGSRKSGLEARNYIKNLLRASNGQKIHIDFSGAAVISSSFADEVFGKLFTELGPMQFNRMIEIKGTTSTVEALINRAISIRFQTGLNP